MNVLVIHGSMRKGNTYQLTRQVIQKLNMYEDVHIDEISVSELDLPFCLSCHQCFEKGEEKCPHFGTVKTVVERMERCDALIVSGVVYSMHLNAAMKNLIDHLSYYFHRPRLFDKQGLVITTTAGAGEKTVANYLRATLAQWGISGAQKLSMKVQTVPFSLSEKQQHTLDKAVVKFYKTIQHRTLKAPSMKAVVIHNAFRGMSAVDVPVSECDKAYWHQTGLDRKVYPRRVNVFKRVFGAMVYKIMKKVMSQNYRTKQ